MTTPVYGTQPIGRIPNRQLGSDRTFGGTPASGVDWASFDPGQWWQTPGLDPSWFQESQAGWGLSPPTGTMPGGMDWLTLDPDDYPAITGPGGRFDPWETYQDYWAQGSDWQAALDAPFGALQKGGRSERWGPFDPIEIPGIPEETLARIQGWLDTISGSYEEILEPGYSMWDPALTARMEERASPEYSAWGPEQRGAMAESMGGQLALAQRGISETMAQRGIRGSGLEAQLGMTAAGQAARGMGDIRAAIASSDETTRAAALDRLTQMQAADAEMQDRARGGLEGIREFDITGLAGQTTDAQKMLLDFVRMVGSSTMLGPERNVIDPLGLAELGMSREDELSWLLANLGMAGEGPSFLEGIGAGEGIDNWVIRALLASLGGSGAF